MEPEGSYRFTTIRPGVPVPNKIGPVRIFSPTLGYDRIGYIKFYMQ